VTRGSSTKPGPKSVHLIVCDMIVLVQCIISLFYDVSVLSPALCDLFLTPVAQYSLFVLKVLLNTK